MFCGKDHLEFPIKIKKAIVFKRMYQEHCIQAFFPDNTFPIKSFKCYSTKIIKKNVNIQLSAHSIYEMTFNWSAQNRKISQLNYVNLW